MTKFNSSKTTEVVILVTYSTVNITVVLCLWRGKFVASGSQVARCCIARSWSQFCSHVVYVASTQLFTASRLYWSLTASCWSLVYQCVLCSGAGITVAVVQINAQNRLLFSFVIENSHRNIVASCFVAAEISLECAYWRS